MDCFAEPVIGRAFARPGGLQRRLMFQHNSVHWNSQAGDIRAQMRIKFLHRFVDGIFTTFIACLFTNTSDAVRENCTMSCVLHACNAD
jgi:hypothetical protein